MSYPTGKDHHSYGKSRSEETKKKISESRKKNRDKIKYPTGVDHPFYGKHHTDEAKHKISENLKQYTGEKCHRYGIKWSDELRAKLLPSRRDHPGFLGKKHSIESNAKNAKAHYGKIASAETRKKMSKWHQLHPKRGKDNPGYGKPCGFGSGWGWGGWYKGWHFRSLGELRYVIEEIEPSGLEWKSAEKKELRIPYVDDKGSDRTYCADFIIDNVRLVEVKHKRLLEKDKNVIRKKEAGELFCKEHNLIYEMADSKHLSFQKLRTLVESGEVKLVEKWNERFKSMCKKKDLLKY